MSDADDGPDSVMTPAFIWRLLENHALLPGETLDDLRAIFATFAYAFGEEAETVIDFALVYRLAVAHFELPRHENMRPKLLHHFRHEAVLKLLSRAYMPRAEPGSLADTQRQEMARDYFKTDKDKAAVTKVLTQAGYGADAIEVESSLQAAPHLAALERTIADRQRVIITLSKELDRRFSRRAKQMEELSKEIFKRRRLRNNPDAS